MISYVGSSGLGKMNTLESIKDYTRTENGPPPTSKDSNTKCTEMYGKFSSRLAGCKKLEIRLERLGRTMTLGFKRAVMFCVDIHSTDIFRNHSGSFKMKPFQISVSNNSLDIQESNYVRPKED